jgi:hypothetical protein
MPVPGAPSAASMTATLPIASLRLHGQALVALRESPGHGRAKPASDSAPEAFKG